MVVAYIADKDWALNTVAAQTQCIQAEECWAIFAAIQGLDAAYVQAKATDWG